MQITIHYPSLTEGAASGEKCNIMWLRTRKAINLLNKWSKNVILIKIIIITTFNPGHGCGRSGFCIIRVTHDRTPIYILSGAIYVARSSQSSVNIDSRLADRIVRDLNPEAYWARIIYHIFTSIHFNTVRIFSYSCYFKKKNSMYK